jgi:hypothetical protein
MKVWELLNGVVHDSRIGNHFGIQECWSRYITRTMEIEYSKVGCSISLKEI